MSVASHVVAYTPRSADDSGRPSLRLTLEPERVERRRNLATLADIDMMIGLAMSGTSARHRQMSRCAWADWADNGDLICSLGLWVWPSDIDLRYALTLPPGVTSAEPVMVREDKNTKYWIGGSAREIELTWLLERARFAWHPAIGVWDAWSRPAEPPGIERNRADLLLSGNNGERYGVLHVAGEAVGWLHRVIIRYPTGQNRDPAAPAISVTNADDVDVVATWTDENGETRTEETTLEIPDCVKVLLEKCPQGTGRGGSIRVRPADGASPVTVYYNSCNGRVLAIRPGKQGGGE